MTTKTEIATSPIAIGSDAARTQIFHAPKVEVVSGKGSLADAALPVRDEARPEARSIIDDLFPEDGSDPAGESDAGAGATTEPVVESKTPPAKVEPEVKDAPPADAAMPAAAAPGLEEAKAEAERYRQELVVERTRARQAPAPQGPSDDEIQGYIADPVAFMRGQIARTLGVRPDDKVVDKEIAYYRKRLTGDAIGVEALDDASRKELRLDDIDRNDRLDQQVKASARERTRKGNDAPSAPEPPPIVKFVSSVIGSAKPDAYPHLQLAELWGENPAEVGLHLLLAERDAGRVKQGLTDDEYAHEAARLGNDYYSNKAKRVLAITAKTRPHETSPTATTATAQASAATTAAEARKSETTQATATTAASASPATLRAKQAAEAPAAVNRPPEVKRSIDPHKKGNTQADIDSVLAELGIK